MDGLADRLIETNARYKNYYPQRYDMNFSSERSYQYRRDGLSVKPIRSAKVLETIENSDRFEEERNLREMQIRYRKEMQENENYQRRQFFSQLISDSTSVPEILNRANELDIDLAAKSYNIILFICSQKDESSWEKYSGKLVQMEEKIENNFSMRKHMILFRAGLKAGLC